MYHPQHSHSQLDQVIADIEPLKTLLIMTESPFVTFTESFRVHSASELFRQLHPLRPRRTPATTAFMTRALIPLTQFTPNSVFMDHVTTPNGSVALWWSVHGHYRHGALKAVTVVGSYTGAALSPRSFGRITETQLFEMMNHSAAEAFYVLKVDPTDPRGLRSVFCSRLFVQWWGTDKISLDNWLSPIVTPKPVEDGLFEFLRSARERHADEFVIKAADTGQYRWVRAVSIKILGSQGEMTHLFSTIQDITASVLAADLSMSLRYIYELLRDHSPDIIILVDLAVHRPLFISKAWERYTGAGTRSVEENDVEYCRNFIPEDEADWFIRRFTLFMAGKGPLNIRHRFVNMKTGALYHMDLKGTYIREGGRPSAALLVATEVSDLVEAQRRMAETSVLFDQMATTLDDAFWICAPPTVEKIFSDMLFVSYAAHDLLGISPEVLEYDVSTLLTIMSPDTQERILAVFSEFNYNCVFHPADAELHVTVPVTVEGRVKQILIRGSPVLNMRGKVVRVCGVVTDVTELLDLQDKLETSIKWFDLISDNLDCVFYLLSAPKNQTGMDVPLFRMSYINRYWTELTGLPMAKGYDSNYWWTVVHPDDRDYAMKSFTDWTLTRSYRIVRQDGRTVHVTERRVRLTDDGDNLSVAGFVMNNTDLVIAQQQKTEAQAQLHRAQKLESLGVLAGGVSHDFNNALTIVMGNTDMALELVEPGTEVHGMLQEMIEAATRACTFTAQLLSYSGKGQMQVSPVNLATVVSELSQVIRASATPNISVSFEIEDPETVPLIRGDSNQLRQVVMNLTTNGMEAIGGDDPGHFRLSVYGCSYRDVVALEVSDTGKGMSVDVQARLFEPFFSTKSIETVSGMGLAAVKGIVDNHKGKIEVRTVIVAMEQLNARVDALCKHFNVPNELDCLRVAACATKLGLRAEYAVMPHDYYDRTLEERRRLLKAASTDALCKSLIFENIHYSGETGEASETADAHNSRYYICIVQYNRKISDQKLAKFVRTQGGLSRKQVNLRVASEGDALAGFQFNGVAPVGMLKDIPIIVSDAIMAQSYIYCGGGVEHVKMGVKPAEYVSKYRFVDPDTMAAGVEGRIMVADITV
ncbi:Histidine kinase-, DNA gyrase B-, and HSP90-like ATPase [Carpediemonas membranifera]|uniref:Histidine kinase-, DNA gyrase B-, and HSP90-like ATPase n=1 Tax=Carpediemonas membranifera TaxID=201153 RepID=A0A8J6B8R1_9EUKA|nr:Histidine kinase-, DNA gyrase B-, and HSP90-like ATPase [Carpediemonas membranifera]|eukprot:KAG9396574.1 Histidine kinase-, DNA gyrase B-, and HSP90-like ATPase [Carpediemonas membranifera]